MGLGSKKLGSHFQVNTYTAGYVGTPAVTSLEDGGYVVTWHSYDQDGSLYGVFGQRYDAGGTSVGTEFQINTYTARYQLDADVTGLADGGFVVTWSSSGQDGDHYGIFGQRFDANGAALGAEFQINSYTTGNQNLSAITALNEGGFLVTWSSVGQDGNQEGVFGQRFDVNGAVDGDEFQINTHTKNGQLQTSTTALVGGGFVVTWQSNNQDGSGYGIYGQRYHANGTIFGAEFQINTFTEGYQENPKITALTDGGFVVTWQSGGHQDGNNYGVFGQRYAADGDIVGAEFQINTYNTFDQERPDLTALADGGFVVTWVSYKQDGSLDGVFGQRFDAIGDTVGAEFQINTYTFFDQFRPAITALKDGGFVVTWEANWYGSNQTGIYGQQYKAQLFGTADNDTMDDSVGANWMHGQRGHDVLNGLDGDDTIFGGLGKDRIDGGDGNDLINGGLGDDFLNGGRHDDRLEGGDGNDLIKGGFGNDVIIGGKGSDQLFGNRGDDRIVGNNGADTITGGLGKDTLHGGLGADVFVFTKTTESGLIGQSDHIVDFKTGADHIDLSAMIPSGFSFVGTAGFSGTGTEIRVMVKGGNTLVQIDADGDGRMDSRIVLEGVLALTVDDFLL